MIEIRSSDNKNVTVKTQLLSTKQIPIEYSYNIKLLNKFKDLYKTLGKHNLKVTPINVAETIYATCAMEGAVSSVADIVRLMNNESPVETTNKKSYNMIKNHIELYDNPPTCNIFDKPENIREVWDMLSKDAVDDNDGGYPFRASRVVVKNPFTDVVYHEGLQSDLLQPYMSNLYDWLKESEEDAVIKAIVLHFCFEHYHPFCDCNGRVGRYLLQQYLIQNGYPDIMVVPINTILYQDKLAYDSSLRVGNDIVNISANIKYMLDSCIVALIQTIYVNMDNPLGEFLKNQNSIVLDNNVPLYILDKIYEYNLIDLEESSDYAIYLKEEVYKAIQLYNHRLNLYQTTKPSAIDFN